MAAYSKHGLHVAAARNGRRAQSLLVAGQPLDWLLVNRQLQKVDVTGGQPQFICDCNGRPAPDGTTGLSISPDQQTVVLAKNEGRTRRLWLIDSARKLALRFTSGQASEQYPVWSPDSRSLIFAQFPPNESLIVERAADGRGADNVLHRETNSILSATEVSSDGHWCSSGRGRRARFTDFRDFVVPPRALAPGGLDTAAFRGQTTNMTVILDWTPLLKR